MLTPFVRRAFSPLTCDLYRRTRFGFVNDIPGCSSDELNVRFQPVRELKWYRNPGHIPNRRGRTAVKPFKNRKYRWQYLYIAPASKLNIPLFLSIRFCDDTCANSIFLRCICPSVKVRRLDNIPITVFIHSNSFHRILCDYY